MCQCSNYDHTDYGYLIIHNSKMHFRNFIKQWKNVCVEALSTQACGEV